MSKMIQLRNVPDALHRTLKIRAADQGVSLSDLVIREIRKFADRPTLEEMRKRLEARPIRTFRRSATEYLRDERDRR
jgi:plasmid stability protein